MTTLGYLAMFGAVPVGLILFAWYPPWKAALLTLFGGWMFLPMATVAIPGFLDYSKATAMCYTVLLGLAIFDQKSLLGIRVRWFDLPVVFFCMWPGICAIANGFGAWEGVSDVAHYMSMWGVPYLIGKAYFADEKGMRCLAGAFIVAGLVYVPFCLFEVRFSPQLHCLLYGYYQCLFEQTFRLGGWRPMVFMQHGIQLALFMVISSLCGFWMWWTNQLPRRLRKRSLLLLIPLWVTTILTRSTGALALGILVMGTIIAGRMFSSRWIYLLLLLIAPLWVTLRATDSFSGNVVGQLATAATGDEQKLSSMRARLIQENRTCLEALQSPVFGHTTGRGLDQMWLLEVRNHGFPQLIGLIVLLNLPLALAAYRWNGRELAQRETVGLLMALIPALFLLDSLFNSMPMPIYSTALGASISYFGAGQCVYQHDKRAIVVSSAKDRSQSTAAPSIQRRLVPGRLSHK